MGTFEFEDGSEQNGHDPGTASRSQRPVPAPDAASTRRAAGTPVAASKQLYTALAQQGVDAAAVVNAAMQKRMLGTRTPRHVQVIAPHGPSTSGGKLARQSITLTPATGGGAAIVFGFLDVAAKSFEVRPHALVAEQFKARFGEPFEATPDEYAALTKDLGKVLATLGFTLSAARADSGPDAAATPVEANEDFDEYDGADGAWQTQKLLLLGAALIALIVAAVWWLQ